MAKAEFAKSYIAQPKISRFGQACLKIIDKKIPRHTPLRKGGKSGILSLYSMLYSLYLSSS